jgi:hypothetical protein
MQTEGEINRGKAIELLSERLAFARVSVALYGTVLQRLRQRGGPYDSVRGHLRLILEEKKSHQEWLQEKVSALGGDTEQAPGNSLLREEWANIVAGLGEGTEPGPLFESLLTAEVYDNGGWEMLLELAERFADEEMAGEIRQMLHEEQEHFLFVGRFVARFARSSILDETPLVLEGNAA